jgi:hypothetical protein
LPTIATEDTQTNKFNGIIVGYCVWIKNKLKKRSTWTGTREWFEKEGRTDTVTGFAKGQLHFITDKGMESTKQCTEIRTTKRYTTYVNLWHHQPSVE